MKTTIAFIAIFLYYFGYSFAQINPGTPWVWMKGDNTIDQPGVYGTQGIPAATNKPGARTFSTTWNDANGTLWLFGGYGFDGSSVGILNDLWKYNPTTNEWTWVKGDNSISQYAVYGVQGNPAINNKPGAAYSSVSWTDSNGTLWVFGGYGYTNNDFGFLNSLWKYNPTSNSWTWVKGDNSIDKVGNYGTQGIESSTNKPGARYGSLTWVDSNNNLWLFGGYGFDGSSMGILNDLWKYNLTTNKWTWVKGDNSVGKTGTYGTNGVPNLFNKPGGRYLSTAWKDNAGNFYVFGGYGHGETNSGSLNDLWKYDPLTNMWTWIKGDKTVNNIGIYGNKGVVNINNKPGGRYQSCSWKDSQGNLWLFGGYGFDTQISGNLNDFWKYNPINNTWTWIKGDSLINQLGIYGEQGTPNTTNKSGSRTASVSWTDNNGNLWLFGGDGFGGNTAGILNDLWKVSAIEIALPLKLISFSGILKNKNILLQWQTTNEEKVSHFIIQRSFDGINFSGIGQKNSLGSNTINNYDYDDIEIVNHNVAKVFYRLQMFDEDGQFKFSKVIFFDLQQTGSDLSLFPNPTVNTLQVLFTQNNPGKTTLTVTGMNGAILNEKTITLPVGKASVIVEVNTFPAGVYVLTVRSPGNVYQHRFIKQ